MVEMEIEQDTCGSTTCNKVRNCLLWGTVALYHCVKVASKVDKRGVNNNWNTRKNVF